MEHDRDDERVSLHGIDPEEALKALLAVDPESEPAEDEKEREPDEDKRST
jgi:hypothetical protein